MGISVLFHGFSGFFHWNQIHLNLRAPEFLQAS
jgi:hypothetical protein